MHKLIFSGRFLPGHDHALAKRKLLKMLGISEEQSAVLFTGRPNVIKRDLPPEEAARYRDHLAKRGIEVAIEPPLPGTAAPVAPPPPAKPGGLLGGGPSNVPFPELIDIPSVAPPLIDKTPPPPAMPPRVAPPPRPAMAVTPDAMEEVVCPKCGERQPKRTLCRACATDMPRYVASQQEAEEQARRERQEGYAAAREAPGPRVNVPREPAPPWFGLSFEGRFGRLSYLWSSAAITLFILFGIWLAIKVAASNLGFAIAIGAAFSLAVLLFSLRAAALRCHDIGWSGWLALAMMIPYVNLALTLVLLLVPGTRGDNRFGEQPPTAGGLPAVAGIVCILASVAAMFSIGHAVVDLFRSPAGVAFLQGQRAQASAGHREDAADVVIYTTAQCCKEMKAYLRQRGIDFDERNVEEDMDDRKEFYALGGQGVPFLLVRGKPMHGFDPVRFETLLAQRD